MAFDLSFSPEFFQLPGELYDGAEYPHGDRPYSVLGALRAMDDVEFEEMARHYFMVEPDFLTVEMVLERIERTNTCTNLSSPVVVWIDDEGLYTIRVFERDGRPEM